MNRGVLSLMILASCRPTDPRPDPQTEQPGVERSQNEPGEPAREPPIAIAAPERALGVADLGVFSDLDEHVQITLPDTLEPAMTIAVIDQARALVLLYADHRPIKVYPLLPEGEGQALTLGDRTLALRPGDQAELAPLLVHATQLRTLEPGTTPPPGDLDLDGIPDPLDLNLGAIKTTLNGAEYNQDYFVLPYPGGDVARELGACTDVIVRALRNAGVDLQVEINQDIRRAPRRYPMVSKANDDIDHRRVRTLLPWFRAHWIALSEAEPLRPGDVVFMDTIEARKGPDHIGILADRLADDGQPLVANNWTDGFRTSLMALLGAVEVSDRFRMPPASDHRSPIPGLAMQLVVVRSPSWSSFRAQAQRFERATVNGAWRAVGDPIAVVLGHAGLGWGRGLHGLGPDPRAAGPDKREGDGRSPAGVFMIGDAYGHAQTHATELRYHHEPDSLRCVDDPSSRHYATIVDGDALTQDWTSAEHMRRLYALAISIEHNRERTAKAGSCIFLHAWDGPDQPVTGCTAMAADDLERLAGWLAPGAVLAALPEPAYEQLSEAWSLPERPGDGG